MCRGLALHLSNVNGQEVARPKELLHFFRHVFIFSFGVDAAISSTAINSIHALLLSSCICCCGSSWMRPAWSR